jgi:hypothetical protein|tara:strand:- start:504 stop:779 length:276 start_codon:yes stop_codon:yes gene_type:complete
MLELLIVELEQERMTAKGFICGVLILSFICFLDQDVTSFECLFNESLLCLLMLSFATKTVALASSASAKILVCYIDLLLSCVFLTWPLLGI